MLVSCFSQLKRQGWRRLLVLSGEQQWCYTKTAWLSQQAKGDWLWLSNNDSIKSRKCQVNQYKSLLGQEFLHGVFDASQGFHAEAFAGLAGTLIAGSLLVLIVPKWSQWPDVADQDSTRWNEQEKAIPTPHFVRHLQTILQQEPNVLHWHQGETFTAKLLALSPHWIAYDNVATQQQQHCLTLLLSAENGIYVLRADRGRGKSALAGMLAKHWKGDGECWLTAPNKAATQSVTHWAEGNIHFFSPDNVLMLCRQNKSTPADWLIVDEAAAIPLPLLHALVSYFPRILLTSTVQGYEGTGRGFSLKFCEGLEQWQSLSLSQPIRWAKNDPLERLITNSLLMDAGDDVLAPEISDCSKMSIASLQQTDFASNPTLLRQFYGLLISAHYRTNPLDLRRLLDATHQHFISAIIVGNISGALCGNEEGGLPPVLANKIWAGYRRPRGNLVAQSLVAHAGLIDAAILTSLRISRIAVIKQAHRQGIGRYLIDGIVQKAQALDKAVLSVSFGYTDELWSFWRNCGFTLVHIGSKKEACSGCYAAMALKSLNIVGRSFVEYAEHHFQRDWYWRRNIIDIRLAMTVELDGGLTDEDWLELAGFALTYRTIEASYAALNRLLLMIPSQCESLRHYIDQGCSSKKEALSRRYLIGKKNQIQYWRQEVANALIILEPLRYHQLRHRLSEIKK